MKETKKERRLSTFFRALGSEWRLYIIELLSKKSMTVKEMAEELEHPQSFVSRHLQQLNLIGILKYKTEGQFHRYSLNKDKLRNILKYAHDDFFR